MYKRIIAGALSALISTSAISTGNIGQVLRTSAAEKSTSTEVEDALVTADNAAYDATATGISATQSSSASVNSGTVSMTATLPLEVKAGEVTTTADVTTAAAASTTTAYQQQQ